MFSADFVYVRNPALSLGNIVCMKTFAQAWLFIVSVVQTLVQPEEYIWNFRSRFM
jgi:hypothetical protein